MWCSRIGGAFLAVLLATPGVGCGDDDNGNTNNQNPVAVCGDGVVQAGESCDEGPDNSDSAPDACRTDCRPATCGDDVVDSGESCDEGASNSDRIANACRTDCREAGCGDGVIDHGESCDDGATVSGDGCSAACAVEPGWACEDEPSQCACADYRQGDACEQCVVYVDVNAPVAGADGRSWATAFPRLQDGIDRAGEQAGGCAVWVAAGRYLIYEHDHLDTVTLRDHVSVLGGFAGGETSAQDRDPLANVAVLDGASADDPDLRVFHVITAVGTRDATLDGFVITGGNAYGLASNNDDRGGGLLGYSAQVLFDRCVFLENRASQRGGAVYAYASGGLRFRRTVFSDNTSLLGGAVHLAFSPTTFERCTFQANRADSTADPPRGGAVYAETSGARFHRCRFLGNLAMGGTGSSLIPGIGGAVRVDGASAGFEMLSSLFLANSAGEVGGLDMEFTAGQLGGSARVANCSFVGNAGNTPALRWVMNAGGVQTPVPLPLYSCLFADNDPSGFGNPNDPDLAAPGDPQFSLTRTDPCTGGMYPCTSFVADAELVADTSQPLVQSTWTDATYEEARHQTVLVDDTQSWTPDALMGLYVHEHVGNTRLWRVILGNDATSLRVWGRAAAPQVLTPYAIVDPRLTAGSPAIDAGTDPTTETALAVDLLGIPWTDDPGVTDGEGSPGFVDIGAYERVP